DNVVIDYAWRNSATIAPECDIAVFHAHQALAGHLDHVSQIRIIVVPHGSTMNLYPQSRRVQKVSWVCSGVSIEVVTAPEADRILREEAADAGVVISSSVVVELSLGLPLTSCEGIAARGATLDWIAPGIVLS